MTLPHPLRELARWWEQIPVHMAAIRRSWDEGAELETQLQEALAVTGRPVAISTAGPETAFGLAQTLVGHVARLRGLPLLELPLEGLEWAEEAAHRRLLGALPPAGIPPACPDLSDLVSQVARKTPGRLTVERDSNLRDFLYYFHSAYQEVTPTPPPRRARWRARPERALVTGASGFMGPWLKRELTGLEVYPAGRAELASRDRVRELLEVVQPGHVFHLGAQSSVAGADAAALLANVMSQHRLLEGLVDTGARVLVVGSSEEYGVPERLPLDEECGLHPRSLYAVSKVGQDLMGYQFARQYGLHVVRVRSFNHTGPGRGERFMESSFAHQVARIERGLQPPVVRVGNLEARRDFTDVRDAMRAYRLILEHGKAGEVYQVCGGVSHSARSVLEMLLAMSRVPITQEVDPERLRPADIPETRGSFARLQAATGWTPSRSLEETLRDLLESARTATG